MPYTYVHRHSLGQEVRISQVGTSVQFVVTAPAGNIVKFLMDGDGVKQFVDGLLTGVAGWQ